MGVFKEIPKADGSGITTFYRLDNDKDTVETTSTGGTETMIDYNKALNKPSINNVVLVGNKTLDELGIQPKGDYITEIPSEYITEEELNQKQYATESYVLDKIANIEHFSRQVVDELPLVGKDNVIYLVRKEGAGDDIYNEYIWTGTSYELFGSTATDLSDYYNKDSVNELLDTKVDKQEGKGLSSNDYTNADKSKLASLENYDDSELRAAIDSLHNYDDTEIRQEIDKLSNESEAMSEKIEDIDKTNDYKLEAVRLIKSGDYWIWKDSADNLIDYFKARDLLGTENCILIMEQLDSDGKSMPADYKIDGDRIRILYKDLENLNHEMYMGPPDKDEVEGTDIIIDNGAEATLFALGGDGASEQETTTGKNLLNYTNIKPTNNGITNTLNDDGSITTTGSPNYNYLQILNETDITDLLEDGQKYTVMQKNATDKLYIQVTAISNEDVPNYIGLGTNSTNTAIFTVDKKSNKSYSISIQTNTIETSTDLNITNFYQLLKGAYNEWQPFEPYTGGQSSPSPDYPQEISSIEDNLEFNCRGKNLYNYKDTISVTEGITVDDEGWITISGENNNDSGTVYKNYFGKTMSLKYNTNYNLIIEIKNVTGTGYISFISADANKSAQQFKITFNRQLDSLNNGEIINAITTSKDDFSDVNIGLRTFISFVSGQSGSITFRMSVIEDTTITPENFVYEPYQASEYVIDLQGNEMVELPNDIKDELMIDKYGNVNLIKNVGKKILNGSENWKDDWQTSTTPDYIQFYLSADFLNNNYIKATSKNTLANRFETEGSVWIYSKEMLAINEDVKYTLQIKMLRSRVSDLISFKEWLSTHNTIVYYQLANPQTIPLGTLSAEDLAKLKTFDGYNNLFINTNLGYMDIKVTYSTNTNYNENIILGDDSYYYGIVDNKQSLPEGKAKGTLCQTKDTKDFYIYNGEEWIPVDKTASFDLSNYLSKDNTTPYSPSDRYNPATKQYVDTNIQGLRIPTKVSQLENDSNYITENTNTLVNYYNKNNTYNKKEVDALIDSSGLTPVSVTLNGQKTTDANFYAPISGGTANQILVSNGNAAPAWQNNTAVQTVNQDIKLVISDIQPEAPSSGFILWVDSTK